MTAKVRVALFVAVSVLVSGAVFAQSTPSLSKKEKSEKIKALPDEERKWLTDYVAPIILPEEENLFLLLTTPYQREMFKTEFWKRRVRDGLQPPLGPGYDPRYAHLPTRGAAEQEAPPKAADPIVL